MSSTNCKYSLSHREKGTPQIHTAPGPRGAVGLTYYVRVITLQKCCERRVALFVSRKPWMKIVWESERGKKIFAYRAFLYDIRTQGVQWSQKSTHSEGGCVSFMVQSTQGVRGEWIQIICKRHACKPPYHTSCQRTCLYEVHATRM